MRSIVIKTGFGGARTSGSASQTTTSTSVGQESVAVGKGHNQTVIIGATVVVLVVMSTIFVSVLAPGRLGEYHDDAIYVTTAKALATGQGYRIISLPFEPAQTKYPPFYPFLLSLIWRVYPQFPQNLIWMMLLSVVATLSFLGLTFGYLVRQGYSTPWQALIVVTLAAINWRTLTLATGIYSEMVYGALSVAALYIADAHEKDQKSWPNRVLLGALLGLAFLTRSSGIALLISVGAYYLIRKQPRKAFVSVGVGGLFVFGWVGWCFINKTRSDAVNVAYYTSYFGHFSQVVSDLGMMNHTSWPTTLLGIVGRNALMLIVISIPVVCLGIPYEWILPFGFTLMFFAAGFYRRISHGLRLLHVYLICYLALHLFWLPNVTYDRFLIPLLPFLLLILVSEFAALTLLLRKEWSTGREAAKKVSVGLIGLAMIAAAGTTLYSYGSNLYSSIRSVSTITTNGPAGTDAEAIRWINAHTNQADVLVCYCDPLYFLYTGHKATRSLPMRAGVTWEAHQMSIFTIINQSNSRYLISTSKDFENEYQPEQQRESRKALIDQHPEKFSLVFESTDGRSAIYAINSAE
jgi:hypothetical protein